MSKTRGSRGSSASTDVAGRFRGGFFAFGWANAVAVRTVASKTKLAQVVTSGVRRMAGPLRRLS
jgi:hypothetical protein